MNFNNDESQFVDTYHNIERAVYSNNYQKAMDLIHIALSYCQKLYEEAIDQKQKTKWKENAEKLKKIYSDCKSKLAEDNIEYVPRKPVEKRIEQKENEKEKKVEKKANDNINFVIDGIDLKSFLIMAANDNVSFKDVCGMENEKKEIIKEFFIDEKRKKFRQFFEIKNKNFILLYGVPGTGKTYFAKAISNELKLRSNDVEIPFFAIECAKIRDCKVGASEKNIQAIFEFSKQFDQCVLFFDEFDAIVPDRKKETGDPTAKTNVTTFLQMINGFNSSKSTLVIAATNYPYHIDSAIISRADEQIEIPLPSIEVIKQMLDKMVGKYLDETVDLEYWSKKLEGYSSRDIDHLINKLKEYAEDEFEEKYSDDFGIYKITNKMFIDAIEKIKATTREIDLININAYKNGTL